METIKTFLLSRLINSKKYEFRISYQDGRKYVLICVSVLNEMIGIFMKEENNSHILNEIANSISNSIDDKLRLKLNPYDSGIEWHGLYQRY